MEQNTKTNLFPFLLVSLTILVIIRILPALKSPLSTYGYDYGFYFFAAGHTTSIHWTDLFTAIWGGFNNPLFYIAHWLHIPAAGVINELYFIFTLLLGVSFYFWMKNKNTLAGIFASLLVAASQVQSEAYTMYLWKNVAALPILFLAFKFLEEKKYKWLAVCTVLILLTHRTTAIVYLTSVGIYVLIKQIQNKKYAWIIAEALTIIAVFAALWPKIKPIIDQLIHNNNYYVTTGLFLEGRSLVGLWWPILLLALPGAFLYVKHKQHLLLPIFTGLIIAWISFKLPFYRRMLLYLDLCLIAYASYFLSKIDYSSKWMKVALSVILLFFIYRGTTYVLAQRPLITQGEVIEIKNFHGARFILAVSANDAPWILGYAKGSRLGAPGLLEDPHTYQEWMDFWQGKNQTEFVSKYPRPLYLYQRTYRMTGAITQCLKPVTENFYLYDCN